MKKSILKSVCRIAREKLSLHPELNNFPHYSFIVQDNKIIEWATNIKLEPPKHWGYHKLNNDWGFVPKFHSEVFAYKKARGILNDSTFEIINLRFNKKGELKLSKPCQSCFELMIEFGCTKFYYSSDIGFLELK